MSRSIRTRYEVEGRTLALEARLTEGVLHAKLSEAAAGAQDGVPELQADLRWIDDERVELLLEGRRVRGEALRKGGVLWVSIEGEVHRFVEVEGSAGKASAGRDATGARSPMTGTLIQVHVEAGQSVAEGEALFVVEAMKMEYVVRAPRDVQIHAISAEAGEQVELDAEIVRFAVEASGT